MKPAELYALFRSDTTDTVTPYLWSDVEVWLYMNEAYQMFVRLTGGVGDSTSDITDVAVVAGEALAEVSPSILKFRKAVLQSTGRNLRIVNEADLPTLDLNDYGLHTSALDNASGAVRLLVIAEDKDADRGFVRWVQVPEQDDTVHLSVRRLPLDTITSASTRFADVQQQHHMSLLDWMKYRAYGKQDADTFDRETSEASQLRFERYCARCLREESRYRSDLAAVAYGGL